MSLATVIILYTHIEACGEKMNVSSGPSKEIVGLKKKR